MAVQELIEAHQLFAVDITVVVAVIEAFLATHEAIRVRFDYLANSRMIPQISLEIGMVVNEIPVVNEGGLFAKAIRDFAMIVQKTIEARQLLPVDVVVLSGPSILSLVSGQGLCTCS